MIMKNILLDVYHDVFPYEENLELCNKLLRERTFKYGERDDLEFPPMGMVFDFDSNDPLFSVFENKILERNIEIGSLQRSYVNLFLPFDRPFFHKDGNVVTILFYLNPKVDYNQNGETQFLIDNKITGILPTPGSMVCFDGTILHRATSFRNFPRITVAFKYNRKQA